MKQLLAVLALALALALAPALAQEPSRRTTYTKASPVLRLVERSDSLERGSFASWKGKLELTGKLILEFFITPFDYAAYEGPARSVESKLVENKVIGMSWSVLDYDDDKSKTYRGFWNIVQRARLSGQALPAEAIKRWFA